MKITCKPSFVIYLLMMTMMDYRNGIAMTIALSVHEASHYVAARIIREPIERMELTPFGGIMLYKPGTSSSKGVKGIALSLSGPVGNWIALWGLCTVNSFMPADIQRTIINANLSMMMLNLIPVLPLDGGTALFCIGYYVFNVALLIRILSGLGILSGFALCVLSIWGFAARGILNITLLIVGGYIIAASKRCAECMLIQNMAAVLYEHMEREADRIRPIKLYQITGSESLYEMIPYISEPAAAMFVCTKPDGSIRMITKETASRHMLINPYQKLCEIGKNSTEK